jgi:hypothetical protein
MSKARAGFCGAEVRVLPGSTPVSGCIETSRDTARDVRAVRRARRTRTGFGILSDGGSTTRTLSRFSHMDGDGGDRGGVRGDLVPGSVVEARDRLRQRRPLSGRHALLRGRVPRQVRRARRRQHHRRTAGDHLPRRDRRLLRLHARLSVQLRRRATNLLLAGGRGELRRMPLKNAPSEPPRHQDAKIRTMESPDLAS